MNQTKRQRDSDSSMQRSTKKHKVKCMFHEYDVLGGRGQGVFKYPGNVYLRALAKQKVPLYYETSKSHEKTAIAKQIVLEISNRGGRFFGPDMGRGDDRELLDHNAAMKKVKTMLRDFKKNTDDIHSIALTDHDDLEDFAKGHIDHDDDVVVPDSATNDSGSHCHLDQHRVITPINDTRERIKQLEDLVKSYDPSSSLSQELEATPTSTHQQIFSSPNRCVSNIAPISPDVSFQAMASPINADYDEKPNAFAYYEDSPVSSSYRGIEVAFPQRRLSSAMVMEKESMKLEESSKEILLPRASSRGRRQSAMMIEEELKQLEQISGTSPQLNDDEFMPLIVMNSLSSLQFNEDESLQLAIN